VSAFASSIIFLPPPLEAYERVEYGASGLSQSKF
jgi:hypothetical protein